MTMILDGTLGITATGSLTGLTTAITAAQGGTGAATLTANNVLLGNGTSAVTFVAPSTSGNLLTSNGTTWASTAPAAAGSMTLLGTVTATSGNSVSLGSLNLTSYINLQIIYKDIVGSSNSYCYISSSNSQNDAHWAVYLVAATPVVCEGFVILNLPTGNFVGSGGTNVNGGAWAAALCGQTNITTATTTIYFRLGSTYTYGGSGSILVYGVK